MNRRGRRLAFTVAATGLAVVLVLGMVYRVDLRDHLEAWRFQLTRATKTIEPLAPEQTVTFQPQMATLYPINEHPLQVTASFSGYAVIFDPKQMPPLVEAVTVSRGGATGLLKAQGWRVIEQRFPRKAYVLIRDEGATQ
jgi:hypothetical protein